MDYVNLGRTGLKVSRICLGCMTYGAPASGELRPGSHAWALSEEESQPYFRSSARTLGDQFLHYRKYIRAARAKIAPSGRFLKANTRREAVVIATKLHGTMRDEPNGGGLSRKEISSVSKESLRRLRDRLDVDLYQISSLGLRDANRGNA